jgi:hypothetical protein
MKLFSVENRIHQYLGKVAVFPTDDPIPQKSEEHLIILISYDLKIY